MSCRDVLEQIEAIVAGDQALDAEMRAHFESCPRCAAALATARRIEDYLAARPVVPAPAKFTFIVLHRIRRERWRSEERVDRLFNIAVIFSALLVLTGAGFLFNMGAALELATEASKMISRVSEEGLRRAAPSLGTYLAAMALLMSALGMWWWADMSVE